MPKILALDYGGKRTGIAVTDDLKIIASGLTTVPTKELLTFLKVYVASNQVESFVMGYPLKLNDQATHNTKAVEDFAEILKKEFPAIPVYFEDERFSSKMAQQSMIQMGMKKKNRQKKELLDEISAVLILQSFMEHGNSM